MQTSATSLALPEMDLPVSDDPLVTFDARPCYRIAVFGLGPRFQQLLDVVGKHARLNNFRYQVAEQGGPGDFDIALVDMTARGGADIARTLKSVPQTIPVIGVGRRSNRRSGNDDLLLATFSLDVLGVLNKAAQSLSTREGTRRQSGISPQADASQHLPQISGRPPRALVVEPSPAVRIELAAALRQIGVDAEGVGTLAQAEDVLSMRSYEVMILDPQQPDGDGLAALRRLRHEAKPRRLVIPVIVLSSRSGVLDLVKAAWAGSNGYLGKPVTVRSLHSTVRRVLMRSLRPRLDAQRNAVREKERARRSDFLMPAEQPAPTSGEAGKFVREEGARREEAARREGITLELALARLRARPEDAVDVPVKSRARGDTQPAGINRRAEGSPQRSPSERADLNL
ncbi:MAG TPA: response regulator [Lautropia sp.]|jgi:DNA-binding response OmpR family regulator|nr:response regulator [Lautropia sp.]